MIKPAAPAEGANAYVLLPDGHVLPAMARFCATRAEWRAEQWDPDTREALLHPLDCETAFVACDPALRALWHCDNRWPVNPGALRMLCDALVWDGTHAPRGPVLLWRADGAAPYPWAQFAADWPLRFRANMPYERLTEPQLAHYARAQNLDDFITRVLLERPDGTASQWLRARAMLAAAASSRASRRSFTQPCDATCGVHT